MDIWVLIYLYMMIQIIDQVGQPIRLKAYRRFIPGQIVRLVRTRQEVYCTLSDSLHPFGMVLDEADSLGHIPIIYNSASLIQTEHFEPGDYWMGALVYCSDWGCLTLDKPQPTAVPIAYVEKDWESGNPLEIRWI